jgi:hypothetical protein
MYGPLQDVCECLSNLPTAMHRGQIFREVIEQRLSDILFQFYNIFIFWSFFCCPGKFHQMANGILLQMYKTSITNHNMAISPKGKIL